MKKTKNILVSVGLAAMMLFPTTISASSENIERLNGNTRVETSIAVSQESYPAGSSDVILAGYHGEADALTGTLLAASKDAPLLLIHQFNQAIRDEFERLNVQTVHLLGGPSVLSQSLEKEIKQAGYEVNRVAGSGRFETAVEVANASSIDTEHAFLTNDGRSGSLADALAIGPVSGREKDPILLTNKDKLPRETLNALNKMKIKNVTIVGGPGAVSENVKTTLENRDIQVSRIAGYNRWNTAEKIANRYFNDAENVIIANDGRIGNFADALMGGYLGAKKEAPILLTQDHEINNETTTFLVQDLPNVYILGGPSVVQAQVADAIQDLLVTGGIGDLEPNDSFRTATPLKIGSTINGSLSKDTDRTDYYRITLPTAGHLRFNMPNRPRDVNFTLYNENQESMYSSGTHPLDNKLLAGTYYFKIDWDRSSARTIPYELTSSFVPSAYPDEDAGSALSNATAIGIDDHVKGTIGYQGSTGFNSGDYFKVDIPTEGMLETTFRTLNGHEHEFGILDPNRHTIRYPRRTSDSTERAFVQPGTHYIYIKRNIRRELADSYDLVTSFTPSQHTSEEAGDHFVHATPIEIGEEINGTIGYGYGSQQNTEDYFKIEAPSTGTLEVEIAALDMDYLVFEFYDKDSNRLYQNSNITTNTIQLDALSGTHYLVVKERYSSSPGSYRMTTFFESQ